MHRKFPSPPPERIEVQLESMTEPIVVYRFDAMLQLQQHLLRHDLYGDLTHLNVDPNHRWDQSHLSPSSNMGEVTDGEWYRDAVDVYITNPAVDNLGLNQPEQFQRFLITLEQYQDSTGTDNKESFSLEPVVLTTGILKSKFTGDSTSRFPLGYIPSLANDKSSATQSHRRSALKGFGLNVRDYHKCLSVILEPLVEAMKNPPLLRVLLGDQVRKVRATIVMGAVLGDGKSNDMSAARVMNSHRTLRLSRATLTPSQVAADVFQSFTWIQTHVIETLTRAAKFDEANGAPSNWNRFLAELRTQKMRDQHHSAAKRRARISTDILRFALGSHAVDNAFFSLNFASPYGIFGHSLADIMHLLEEGLILYVLATFLNPLSDSVLSQLDIYTEELLGPKANRCTGRRNFPRVNFTRGYSRLTLLASHERVGQLLALTLILLTKRGQSILESRFSPGFDERRVERAARFTGADVAVVADDGNDDRIDVENQSDLLDPGTVGNKRPDEFTPTRFNINYVFQQMKSHDLTYLLVDVFPYIPTLHIYECLKIIWQWTHLLRDDAPITTVLPSDELNNPPYMADNCRYRRVPKTPFSKAILNTKFLNNPPQPGQQTFDVEQPTITTNESDFLQCCEQLLALRSFYNYSGVHCPEAIPLKEDGTLDVESVEEHTRVAAQLLKLSVNRGKGTMHWNIPKFIDLLLLPHYMGYLGSTGRFHVGFAERGLKQWAKKTGRHCSETRRRGIRRTGSCSNSRTCDDRPCA